MKNKIQTSVQLYLNDIELKILVTRKLKKKNTFLNSGYIETPISEGKVIFWDNLEFFINCGKKEFKIECMEDLNKANYNWEQVYEDIKTLLKRAKKLNIISR